MAGDLPTESSISNALVLGCASALRADGEVCDQCAGLGWVRIKGYVFRAACGYITATECMACNPDGRIAYVGQIDFINADRPLTEVP